MSRRGTALFIAMCLIWGAPYLLIKVAIEQLSPVEVVFLRCVLAAAVLVPWAAASGQLRPVLRHWRPVLLFTVLEMTVPWLLLPYAEQSLTSSLTGLLVAGVPMVAALAGRLTGDADRLDRSRLFGLALGMAGVAALLGLDVAGGQLLAVVAVAVVVVGYATGPLVVSRSLRDVPGVGVSAVALTATALVYLPFAAGPLVREPPPTARVVVAVVLLGLLCTAVALLLFFALIREVGPNRALAITFVNPAVALLLGITLLGEPLTTGMLVGFPLVLLGCVLATRRSRPPAPPVTDRVDGEAHLGSASR